VVFLEELDLPGDWRLGSPEDAILETNSVSELGSSKLVLESFRNLGEPECLRNKVNQVQDD